MIPGELNLTCTVSATKISRIRAETPSVWIYSAEGDCAGCGRKFLWTYLTYGAAHFPGFFAELQQRHPKFAIRSVKSIRPMALPDEPIPAPTAVSGTAK